MKGVYLCARKHRISGYDIQYNDIVAFLGIDLLCSCDQVDLSNFDFIIATPPCNYYSRANWRRETSTVAQSTKHLLPWCLDTCVKLGKPFLIENVCNPKLLPHNDQVIEFDFGNHHFYTNVFFLLPHKSIAVKQNKQYVSRARRDNNYNVHFIIDIFLETIHNI